MVDVMSNIDFPVSGLMPKQETGVSNFLAKYPEYDGRDITIAIFDSGVDPGVPGLQITSTGEKKLIHRYDCSGSGDVDMSTSIELDESGCITGLTGRRLKIPEEWNAVGNQFRVGVKNAFELYPTKLKERIEAERKEKFWEPDHKIALAEATRQLQRYESEVAKRGVNGLMSDLETLQKEDLEAKVDFLNWLNKKYVDLGPVYDCVLFREGQVWRACIDTSEDGDLKNGVTLREYSLTFEYASLTKSDQLNISINVHDDGNVLEIVGLCSGHGTHVASIAAANFPNNPEKNGVAPGAKVVSLTVGDGRLGSMETGTALVRAMIKVMELQKTCPIHVINMSYGEHANFSNSGRIGDLMNEVVNKYGVVWVSSAGNHGPALGTVCSPPDISQSTLIGVGAYVSPSMMESEYSLLQKLPGTTYTWTSSGPTLDGDLGISVCAPGAAITSVPNFTLRNAQLLNGTSMAAPHVAGAVGILLSGLVKRNVKWSPYSMKRALENSAKFLNSVGAYNQGHGLLQVEKAFEHLVAYKDCPANLVRFGLSCGPQNSKGILLRSGVYTQPVNVNVTIEPFFLDSDTVDPQTKIDFEMRFTLMLTGSAVCPNFLDMQNQARTISIRIDPADLRPGVHLWMVRGYDVSCVDKGPLISIPITVIQPMTVGNENKELIWKGINFQPSFMNRFFIMVPELATWGIIKLRGTQSGKLGRFVIHCMQLRPKQNCKALESMKIVQISSNSETVHAFQVKGGLVLEIVTAKYWSSLGDMEIDYSLQFFGVKPENPAITMYAVDGLYLMEIKTLRSEEVHPCVTLKNSVQVLKPTESKISPLTTRDVIPIGRQIYELVLSYDFHISKACELTPNSALLSDVLYESEFESQLWMLFDSNKQLLCSGDAFPSKYNVKLEKGDFVIRLQVRHDKRDLLEKLMELPMLVSRKLANSINLDVYSSYCQAITQQKKIVPQIVAKDMSLPIYISPFLNEKSKLPTMSGQYLTGTISYAKDETGKKVDTYPFKFVPFEPGKKSSSKAEKDKSKMEEYSEALRDLKNTYLAKLDPSEAAYNLYEELKTAYPEYLAIHSSMMQCLDPMENKKQLPLLQSFEMLNLDMDVYNKILAIADVILDAIDMDQLLSAIAVKTELRPDSAKIKSQIDKQKTSLLDALTRKCIVFSRIYIGSKFKEGSMFPEQIRDIAKDIFKFVDLNDAKGQTNVFYFALWHAAIHEHYGRMLKYLTKLSEEKPARELEEKIAEICEKLKWTHCTRFITKSLPIKFPLMYRPF